MSVGTEYGSTLVRAAILLGLLLAMGQLRAAPASALEVPGAPPLIRSNIDGVVTESAGLANAKAQAPFTRSGSGTISQVDFDGPTIVIAGLRYGFTPDARVTIGGTYGAPTLLQAGMSARFAYRTDTGTTTAGSIFELEQVGEDAVAPQ